MLNKTQFRIIELFVSKIRECFTLREVATNLGMNVSLAHRNIDSLVKENYLRRDKHKRLSLNVRLHHDVLVFSEYLRSDSFLSKNKVIKLFSQQVLKNVGEDSFVLLIFGSAVISTKPRDIDVLLIVEDHERTEKNEGFLRETARNYTLPFETHVISFESVYEMLKNPSEANLMNEILNKHLIIHGAELFYRLIDKGIL